MMIWMGILLLTAELYGSDRFTETLPFEGKNYCCTKQYAHCEGKCTGETLCLSGDCKPDIRCLQECVKKNCKLGSECQKTENSFLPPDLEFADTTGLPAPKKKRDRGEIRYDGRLTGPGTVEYDLRLGSTDVTSLKVFGVIYGVSKNGQEVLKKTDELVLFPGGDVTPALEVSPEQFNHWSKIYDPITIGILFANPDEAALWQYRNLLTEEDTKNKKAGEFKVKGEFIGR